MHTKITENLGIDPSQFVFDHVAIAVNSLEEGGKFYTALGLGEMLVEEVPTEGVRVGIFEFTNKAKVELIEPLNPDSNLVKFLGKRGPGIHHICFRVKDIVATLARLKENKVRLINLEPSPGAHNCMIAFIHPSATGGVLVEISQKMDPER